MQENLEKLFLLREKTMLSPYAFLTENTKGRLSPVEKSPFRTEFQRDRDRIIHSKAFRRLMHKTQVFFSPRGEHYRTRMTHTLEVTQIARIIARALRLNEDLAEAIAMGHDLGHTPFGHSGERALQACYDEDFAHYKQSLRVADKIERLNLTYEVRDGILHHTGKDMAETLEGVVVKFADRIAYTNHDFDDACRAGVLTEDAIPFDIRYVLGNSPSERIDTMVSSVIAESGDGIRMAPDVQKAADDLRTFMFETVYRHPAIQAESDKAENLLIRLYEYYKKHERELPALYLENLETDGLSACVADFVAGMTDRYAIERYESIFIPATFSGL